MEEPDRRIRWKNRIEKSDRRIKILAGNRRKTIFCQYFIEKQPSFTGRNRPTGFLSVRAAFQSPSAGCFWKCSLGRLREILLHRSHRSE